MFFQECFGNNNSETYCLVHVCVQNIDKGLSISLCVFQAEGTRLQRELRGYLAAIKGNVCELFTECYQAQVVLVIHE